MEKESMVYITAMQDSLKSKYEVLKRIFEITKQQEQMLSFEDADMDMDAFDELLGKKDVLIRQIEELDKGFQGVFERVKDDIEKNKQEYKPRILEMQNLIRQITDLGVKIQALEERNKSRFESFLGHKRQEIQGFRANSKAVNLYNQHRANQHQEWQSYFLDKKK